MQQKNNTTTFGDFGADQVRQQQAHSAQSTMFNQHNSTGQLGDEAQLLNQIDARTQGGNNVGGVLQHLSPLEILDQADDDERLLAALEGLTLDTSGIEDGDVIDTSSAAPESSSSAFGEQQNTTEHLQQEGEEPNGEHGTRTEFIKDVSERLITRVNTEAANIDQAKQLMQQYMMEFCAEYDRCGYSQRASSPRSDKQQSWTDRTTSSSAATSATSGTKKNGQQQMAFDNQILKKGVRVLSKNLQRINE